MGPKNENRKRGDRALNQTICVTGPEATGKSILSEQLASRLHCPMVPEFARHYLNTLSRAYREDDLEEILQGQIKQEERAISEAGNGPVVCDTGPEVIWVWSYFKYGRVSPFIEETAAQRAYPATLLLDIDLPWSPDPLRENPSIDERRELLRIYRKLLTRLGRPFTLVSGHGEKRVKEALRSIPALIRA